MSIENNDGAYYEALVKLLGSEIKALEIFLVKKGVKPCARILCPIEKIENTKKILKRAQLCVTQSAFKVIKGTGCSPLYSDFSVRVSLDNLQKGHCILYIAQNPALVDGARDAETNANHEELGKTLGYPACCCAFFEKYFSEKNTDLTVNVLEKSPGHFFSFPANIAARHFDASLLSHFPCSFECKDSVQMALQNFEILKTISERTANRWAALLKSVVIYTKTQGILLVPNYTFHNSTVTFTRLIATQHSKLYYALTALKKFKIISRNHIRLDQESVQGNEIAVMVFRGDMP